jgi:hypothetical protein
LTQHKGHDSTRVNACLEQQPGRESQQHGAPSTQRPYLR